VCVFVWWLGGGGRQITLRRQFEAKEYVVLDWAVNCAALSQYYLGQVDYTTSAHCLLCASKVAMGAETVGEEEKQDKISQINRCWIKYALNLLQEPAKARSGATACAVEFGVEITDDARAAIPSEGPRNFVEAKAIFQMGQTHIRSALKILTLDGHVTDHIEVLQDQSRLYQALVPFVDDVDSKCKLHKRRLDMLLSVVTELNPQYFLAVVRQLQFEIAETYHEMMSLKRTKYSDSNPPDSHATAKINKLGMQCIRWFTAFQDSTRENVSKEIPKDLEDTVERPFLVAKFTSARIYSQLLVSDPSQYADNMKKCEEGYSWCVKYVDDHPNCKCFQEEYPLCKEMAAMLPAKVARELHALKTNLL
jgi:hypothetical protein